MPNDQSPALSFAPAFSALVVGAIAMGVSPIFVRFAEVGPFASAFWRAGLAVPILLIWALLEAQRSKKSGRQDRGIASVFRVDGPILLAGLFFAGDLFFWHLSILNTTIANATLLACLAPVWVLLLSGTLIGETVSRKAYIGLVLCLIGTATLIGSSFAFAPERLLGDLYGFATSIFFGLYFLAVRVARRKHQAGAVTFMSTSVTALVLLAITLLSGQGFLPQTIYGPFSTACSRLGQPHIRPGTAGGGAWCTFCGVFLSRHLHRSTGSGTACLVDIFRKPDRSSGSGWVADTLWSLGCTAAKGKKVMKHPYMRPQDRLIR